MLQVFLLTLKLRGHAEFYGRKLALGTVSEVCSTVAPSLKVPGQAEIFSIVLSRFMSSQESATI